MTSAPWTPPPPHRTRPPHPQATTAMVLGIVAAAGFFTLLVPALAGPIAWYLGSAARRDIQREPERWSGSARATTGMVLGIVATALLAILILVLTLIVVVLAFLAGYDAGYGA